jgi:hypothetical protein
MKQLTLPASMLISGGLSPSLPDDNPPLSEPFLCGATDSVVVEAPANYWGPKPSSSTKQAEFSEFADMFDVPAYYG